LRKPPEILETGVQFLMKALQQHQHIGSRDMCRTAVGHR
jgi:hypothetical protein